MIMRYLNPSRRMSKNVVCTELFKSASHSLHVLCSYFWQRSTRRHYLPRLFYWASRLRRYMVQVVFFLRQFFRISDVGGRSVLISGQDVLSIDNFLHYPLNYIQLVHIESVLLFAHIFFTFLFPFVFCLLLLQILQILSLIIFLPLVLEHFVIHFVGILVLIEAS